MQHYKSEEQPEKTCSITPEEMDEYLILKSRMPKLEEENEELKKIGRNYTPLLLDRLNTLVRTDKYDKAVWLKQYNLYAHSENKKRRNRIKALVKKLNYDTLSWGDKEKADVGFHLYCDYLRKLHKEIKAINKKVDSKANFNNDWRESELLDLFGQAPDLECLEKAYNANITYLKEQVNTLTKINPSDSEIEKYQYAVKGLQNYYELLKDNWKTKVNPLDPSVDDRSIIGKGLGSSILRRLAKEEEGTTQLLLSPAE